MTKRAAVYNRFWHSQGGGERHSGMIASVLSHDGVEVDLVGHTDVDKDELADHLGLDLSKVGLRIVPDRGDLATAALSEDYDLFVNGSYMSRLAPRSAKAAYLCYFPTPFDADLEPWRRFLTRRVGHLVSAHAGGLDFGTGWYPPEGGRRRTWIWASGDAILVLPPSERDRVLRLELGGPGLPRPVDLRVEDEHGAVWFETRVTADFVLHKVPVPASVRGTELHFRAETFTPGGSDPRDLGVAVSRMRFDGGHYGPRQTLAHRYPWLLRNPRDLSFLGSYDAVMANSDFTRGWIDQLWQTDADVLFPPIQVQRLDPSPQREKAVITVGRFFAPGLGHSKRQLEMVETFVRASRAGQLPGWTFYVLGGMEESQRGYVEQVRAAGAGAPVEVLTNVARGEVERLLTTSSVFWSATGLGASEDKEPWASEHFGMTTVEAMAAGCVPVVIDRAGQKEIVREAVDGYRWQTTEQLVERTVAVASDEALRTRLATSAIERAQVFSENAFADRWHAIVAKHSLLG
ncbi:MAG: glycosyltransferase [Mycobacteriales bacterium]|nr:glycosyltransferase [Mycobacteriales bacterium]